MNEHLIDNVVYIVIRRLWMVNWYDWSCFGCQTRFARGFEHHPKGADGFLGLGVTVGAIWLPRPIIRPDRCNWKPTVMNKTWYFSSLFLETDQNEIQNQPSFLPPPPRSLLCFIFQKCLWPRCNAWQSIKLGLVARGDRQGKAPCDGAFRNWTSNYPYGRTL